MRGKEELRGVRHRNFVFENVEIDGSVRSRITFTENRSKANQGGLFRKIDPRPVVHVEDATEENSFTHLFNLYLAKLPQNADLSKALFFTPKKIDNPINTDIWYSSMPIGVNTLNKTVKRLFGEGHSNHSMRVSTVNDLYEAGFAETDIIKRTRHRTVTTLKSYRREDLASTSRASDALSAPSRAGGQKRKHTVVEGTGVAESIAKRAKQEEDLNATLMMIEEMGSDEFDELMDFGEDEDNDMKSVGTGTTAVLPIDLSSITIEVTMNIGQINIPSDTESELMDNGTSKKVGTELSFHANADIKFKVE